MSLGKFFKIVLKNSSMVFPTTKVCLRTCNVFNLFSMFPNIF